MFDKKNIIVFVIPFNRLPFAFLFSFRCQHFSPATGPSVFSRARCTSQRSVQTRYSGRPVMFPCIPVRYVFAIPDQKETHFHTRAVTTRTVARKPPGHWTRYPEWCKKQKKKKSLKRVAFAARVPPGRLDGYAGAPAAGRRAVWRTKTIGSLNGAGCAIGCRADRLSSWDPDGLPWFFEFTTARAPASSVVSILRTPLPLVRTGRNAKRAHEIT